jgi:DNA mismatch repair protein MutL
MPVRVLPPGVRAKIAAGEVIERPASVVKELLENALDAGATEVSVEIEGGGIRLIRVRDDGWGLTPDEVPLAFQRFGTSKIDDADDLLRISTLGFRGEALPSITAVAEVSFLTRPAAAVGGTLARFRGGNPAGQSPSAAPPGTAVTVRDLFKDYPARLKFLRSSGSEASQCARVVEQYALARPEVRFSFQSDSRTLLNTAGSGSTRDAAAAVWGQGVASALLEVGPYEDGLVTVQGLAGPPGVTRSTRGGISTFVNGRWVQHRALAYAAEEAYQGLLMTGRHPIVVLYVTVAPEELDVNVHPRKLEVRLRQEGGVFAAVQRAVRAALVSSAPRAGLGTVGTMPKGAAGFAVPTIGPYLPGVGGSPRLGPLSPFVDDREDGSLPDRPSPPAFFSGAGEEVNGAAAARIPVLRVVGQLNNTYIIAEGPTGMYLVDQHAAHERVVFERINQRLARDVWDQQGLLEPLLVEVPADEAPLLLQQQGALERYGFAFEPFGGRELLFRSLPGGVRQGDLGLLLGELAAGLRAREGWQERLATSMSCHSAVRAGDSLSTDQMRALLTDLEACQAPQTCPHGRPTMIHLSVSQLEREFGRRG